MEFIETDDVVATLGRDKGRRWVVGFALETEDRRLRAIAKLEQKCCDLVVSNGPQAIDASDNDVEVLNPQGTVVARLAGPKEDVARGLMRIIQDTLIG
jgi:phosphopantothenoylcysteine decarboxylase/phosphopantothenate--cysteine ligase